MRAAVAREGRIANWTRAGSEGTDAVYQAAHPGLVACRIYVDQEDLARTEREGGRVGKTKMSVAAAVSREFTGDRYRVHVTLSRRGSRYDLWMDKLLPMPVYGPSAHHDGPGMKAEDMVDDFRAAFPGIMRSFMGLEPAIAQPLINLANLAGQVRPFRPDHLWTDSSRRYYPEQEGEFIFLRSPFDHVYRPSFL